MAQFLDLPLEILPFILQHIVRPNYLTQLSLVNSHFHEFATPLLYRRAFVYAWHREAKAKVNWARQSQYLITSPYIRSLNSSGHLLRILVWRDM